MAIERIVVVTKKTALEELVYRLNTREQARFYIEQNGVSFVDYEQADRRYQAAVQSIRQSLPRSIKSQFIDRDFLPLYQFSEHDLVMTVGPDGLVINTAKYLDQQMIMAINPDPERIDGVLLPFVVADIAAYLSTILRGQTPHKKISMVKATLNDGQVLYGVNDLFMGSRSHSSARYQLTYARRTEQQSSSGMIISTGAGCTGWLSSIVQGAWGVMQYYGGAPSEPPSSQQIALGWESEQLWFTVREPFISKTSRAGIIFGQIAAGQELIITSQMPNEGIIFSDGIEADYLPFNTGTIARIGLAERKAHVLMKSSIA
ncbi:sugar kinase [Tengunoibacter tsumagoiensis]|uniref:Sugar kinase n=1 Tax=Tengunoibacter tsumagoiensis TaxID=2014871 RepID=A0A401ZXC8_9CHLR|nr:sugar kinase [Tengunoibacter tsumagoiensis]GCE11501.1 sugar kinase [Tengunoibacter tsumagoiensis]